MTDKSDPDPQTANPTELARYTEETKVLPQSVCPNICKNCATSDPGRQGPVGTADAETILTKSAFIGVFYRGELFMENKIVWISLIGILTLRAVATAILSYVFS